MNEKIDKFLKKEKILWHNHFIPSLISGVIIGVVFFLWELTTSNIILFASICASAVILANTKSHHLFKLRTVILSYLFSGFFAYFVYLFNHHVYDLHISLSIFILIFLIALLQYLLNIVHPPAISASISFILLERSADSLIYAFIIMVPTFILIRLFVYLFSQNLTIREFWNEFKKEWFD